MEIQHQPIKHSIRIAKSFLVALESQGTIGSWLYFFGAMHRQLNTHKDLLPHHPEAY